MPTLDLDGAGGTSGGSGGGSGGGRDDIPSLCLDDGVAAALCSSSSTSTRTLTSGIVAENTFEFYLLAPSGMKIIMFARDGETVVVRNFFFFFFFLNTRAVVNFLDYFLKITGNDWISPF